MTDAERAAMREKVAQAIHDSIQREAPSEYVGPCHDQADAVLALLAESEPPQSNLATIATNLRIENERLARELEAARAPVSAPEVTDETREAK